MKKVVGVTMVIMLLITLFACGPPVAETTPTPIPEPGTSTKVPEDIIPLTVSGFELVEKKTHVSPLFGGPAIKDRVEYYAYSFFQPEASSKFEGKVKRLNVVVYLFKDIKSSNEYFTTRTENPVSEIQVNNKEAILLDNEVTGADGQYYRVHVYQQYGKLLIISGVNSTGIKIPGE